MRQRIVARANETPACSEIDVAGYLLAPFQDRREIGDAQTQWTHLGVIRRRICITELLIHRGLHRRRDDDSFRLNTHIGRKDVSLQGLLRTRPKYRREVVTEGGDQARKTRRRRSIRDSPRTPLEVPLHTTICGSELQTPRTLKVLTVVVIPYPVLQRRTEQSGSLAVAIQATL